MKRRVYTNKKTCKVWIYNILRLIRPVNSIMMGLAVLIGIFIASQGKILLINTIMGFSVGFLLTAGTMCVNDYIDRDIDAINAPNRPIPSGLILPYEALSSSIILTVFGLIISSFINWNSFFVALISVGVMVSYNLWGKRTGFLGNLMVSFCVSLPFIFGGTVVTSISVSLIIISLMAFLANTGREITKGIADIEGDRIKNVNTLAVMYGSEDAGRVAALLSLAAIAISPIPYILGWLSPLYLIIVSLADIGFLYSSIRLFKGISPKEALIEKSRILQWMLLVLVSFLAGNL